MKYLEENGFSVKHEVARQFIDEQIKNGRKIEDIRSDPKAFQLKLMPFYVERENILDIGQPSILDRALPDWVAYGRLCGSPIIDEILAVCHNRKYQQIFFMDRLPKYIADYARAEDETIAQDIAVALLRVYCELGYEIVFIPFATVEDRAKMVLQRLEETK